MIDRGIDHLVLCARDLAKARERYQSLGFTMTPRAEHPFGTGNSLVQLQGSFLEILSVTRPELITAAAAGHFSFADYNRAFLEKREGFSMLVFESKDAGRDQAEFGNAGLRTYPTFDFQRKAKQPSGEEVTVGFSLAFVTDPRMPDAVFFTCQQHAPQYFWKPDYQKHANSSRTVEEVVMVAADPRALVDLFSGLQGHDRVAAQADRLTVQTSRGKITVLTPAGFSARFPSDAGAKETDEPHLAAYVLGVESLDTAGRCLEASGLPHRREGRMLQVASQDLFGTALGFVEP
ncbi:VOC family protein [Limibacillus halophilus]|uniref:Catechol 2,3-dioxygenase-like lactoylglutathione lyase family enzyme n=1 Tax=Limibacillus halophilus TaxID=1579333 RepID=A0A839T0K5_9PROT|nr:VOC family protein [Limibacillus halophilus]MBB3066683.1 catechol 2,3-dioxygenase-like lactoylglutathione lyase family enzyme [Limibacillus halophilus]